jgi:redox-sensing transcriptional repressor
MKKRGRSRPGRRKKPSIPKVVSKRLSFYLRELEFLMMMNTTTISSQQLSARLGLTSSQVRKDLAHFGQFGYPGLGYNVETLVKRIKKILGRDKVWPVVLVGCGNLGRALVHYKGFQESGFHITAAFDNAQHKIGKRIGNLVIHSKNELAGIIEKKKAMLGILAVPSAAAQGVTDKLVAAGIKGILNFSHITIKVPKGVNYVCVDLAVQMEHLIFGLSGK